MLASPSIPSLEFNQFLKSVWTDGVYSRHRFLSFSTLPCPALPCRHHHYYTHLTSTPIDLPLTPLPVTNLLLLNLPLLLSLLKDNVDCDDDWTIAMTGATCLEAMARTIEDNIVELILPFVTQVRDFAEENLKHINR